MKIYVASSWRNTHQQRLVEVLRAEGHEVYDFRHPPGGDQLGFSWSEVSPRWKLWTAEQYIAALDHPIANAGFDSDFGAMEWADACVLVLPSGRSAHIEAGWFAGAGKPLYVLLDQREFHPDSGVDPVSNIELMYKLAERVFVDEGRLLAALADV